MLAGFAEHSGLDGLLGSSTGLRLHHVEPTGKLEVVARGDDGTRSAWAAVGAEDLASVHVEELRERLDRRLAWGERKFDLDAGRYEVVMPPDAVADLVVCWASRPPGREAEEGRSVFSAPGGGTRVGECFPRFPFSLRSDPVGAGPRVDAVPRDCGVGPGCLGLRQRAAPRAQRVDLTGPPGAASSPPAPAAARSRRRGGDFANNLTLELPGATSSLEDLVEPHRAGLLLTCLWYIREVDPATLLLTGLTRDGVYLVEHGEIVGSVNNFRFNESPVDLLSKTIEAGRTERALSREWNEWLNRTSMPPLAGRGVRHELGEPGHLSQRSRELARELVQESSRTPASTRRRHDPNFALVAIPGSGISSELRASPSPAGS